MKISVFGMAALGIVITNVSLFAQQAAQTPYGICAHVSRHGDHELAGEEFQRMRDAGIGWARTDFDWTTVQHQQNGPWDFSLFDETIRLAEEGGITILPILGYDVAWARPAYKHLDLWREYVRQIVSRYKDRLEYWEIWNEPDLEQFWTEKPNAANYTILLKAAYEEIKSVDPEAKVLLGGLSGIPMEFIKGIYEAGGGAFFDIMNVHPYRYPQTPEAAPLKEGLQKLRELMARCGDADKPVWITEIGWPTHQTDTALLADSVRAGLKTVAPDRADWTLAVFDDPGYALRVPMTDEALLKMLPGHGRVVRLTMSRMGQLSPADYDALLLPLEEGFPTDWFDAMEEYVRQGGTLIFGQGVPLYFTVRKTDGGTWQRGDAGHSYRQRLHIGWEAWWTRQGVPQSVKSLSVPQPFTEQIRLTDRAPEATRFLTDAMLKPGDRFIPLLQAREGDYLGTTAALFDLNSDLKGAVIVSAFQVDYRGVLEDQQATMLTRAYLIALHSGVERMFWYNLRARESDPFYNEDNFGIVHRDLSAKPAYRAMETLNRARPAGSVPQKGDWQDGTLFFPGWKRPDGKIVWAVWTVGASGNLTFYCQGQIAEVFDLYGKKMPVQQQNQTVKLAVSGEPVYLIGP